MKKIVVTGGAGQIAYQLLFRLGSGELLGKDEPFALHILEVPEALQALEGVKMELQDCAYPLLKEIKVGSDPKELFKGVTHAFLIGAKPRSPGMERGDLLAENSKIFVSQGKALNDVADRNVRVLVVGNPCNTNCLIALQNAPDLDPRHFHAMTRLDQNRATFQLAQKSGTSVKDVTHMTIWGNHSATQVPDFFNARIQGKSPVDLIDRNWLEKDFVTIIQKRGAAILAARGKSSASSAATAALDAMKSIITPTPNGEWYSSGILATNNPYEIDEELVFSFPCRTLKNGEVEIVPNLKFDSYIEKLLETTQKELQEERAYVRSTV